MISTRALQVKAAERPWEVLVWSLSCSIATVTFVREVEERLPEWARLVLDTIDAICHEEQVEDVAIEMLAEWAGLDPAMMAVACSDLADTGILSLRGNRAAASETLVRYGDCVLRDSPSHVDVLVVGDAGWPIRLSQGGDRLRRVRPIGDIEQRQLPSVGPCPGSWLSSIHLDAAKSVMIESVSAPALYCSSAAPSIDGAIAVTIHEPSVGRSKRDVTVDVAAGHPLVNHIRKLVADETLVLRNELQASGMQAEIAEGGILRVDLGADMARHLGSSLGDGNSLGVVRHVDGVGMSLLLLTRFVPAGRDAADVMLLETVLSEFRDRNPVSWRDLVGAWALKRRSLDWGHVAGEQLPKEALLSRAWEAGAWMLIYRLCEREDGLA